MTNEEAVKGLKRLFSESELDLPCMDSLEIEEMAIAALEKQIPKKPVFKQSNKTFYCVECKRAVSVVQYHCEHCGQKILWDDEVNDDE